MFVYFTFPHKATTNLNQKSGQEKKGISPIYMSTHLSLREPPAADMKGEIFCTMTGRNNYLWILYLFFRACAGIQAEYSSGVASHK